MALRTRDPRRARFLATQLNAVADRYLFPAFMTEPRLTHQQMQTIFRQVFARNLDKLEAVVTPGSRNRISIRTKASVPDG